MYKRYINSIIIIIIGNLGTTPRPLPPLAVTTGMQ